MELKKSHHTYLYDVYRKIILLAILAHSGYAMLCFMISQPFLGVYNIGSMIFYIIMLQFAKKQFFKLIVSTIHLEVTIFVVVSVLILGWDSGFSMLLIAMASLVYFCPFDHPWITYFISLCEVLVFIVFKQITDLMPLPEPQLEETMLRWFYLLNALASFAIILYGAFITNINSHMREEHLCKENEDLQAIAYYDQLTGCWTRHRMYHSLEDGSIHPKFIALGDVDDFKNINDRFGHMCGDAILLQIATIIKEQLFQKTAIIRWGGEEFVFLFEEEDEVDVSYQIESIRKSIETYHFHYEEEEIHVTMTFGISKIENDLESAIYCADQKMYKGKRSGKNQLQL